MNLPILAANPFWTEVSVISGVLMLTIIVVKLIRMRAPTLEHSARLPLDDAPTLTQSLTHHARLKDTNHA
jgi:hypothetical protein